MSKQRKRPEANAGDTQSGGIWGHLALLAVVFLILGSIRLQYPELSHGDDHADASVLVAGRNYDRLGFFALKFIHVWNPQATDARYDYVFHPPGAEVLHGLMRRLLGEQPLAFYRCVAMALSFAALVVFWFAIRRLLSSRASATAAALLLLCNPVYLSLFDSIHQSPYTEFYRCAALFFLLLLVEAPASSTKARWLLGGFLGCSFLNSLHTFESILGIWLMGVLIVCWVGKLNLRRTLGFATLAAAAPALGISLRLSINAWHYGSLGRAVEGFLNRAAERSLASGDISGTRLTLEAWMENVLGAFVLRVMELPLPALAGMALLLWALFSIQRDENGLRALKVFVILLLSGLTWYVVMPAHTLSHSGLSFMQRHLLLPYALIWTLLARALWTGLPTAVPKLGPVGSRVLGSVPVVLLCLAGVLRSDLPMSGAKQAREQAYGVLKRQLAEVGAKYPKQAEFATNYFRQPMVAHYSDRMVHMVQTPQQFDAINPPPAAFLLVPFPGPATQEMVKHLEAKGYRPSSSEENAVLPFYVFARLGS